MLQDRTPLIRTPGLGNDRVMHDAEADIIDQIIRHLPRREVRGIGERERRAQLLHLPAICGFDVGFFLLRLGRVGPPLVLDAPVAEFGFPHGEQSVLKLAQQFAPPPDPFSLFCFPFLLFGLQHQFAQVPRVRVKGAVTGVEAELVGGKGGGERFVGMMQRELGLSEVVVSFHVGGEEGDAVEAIVDAGVPETEADAGHCAVGEEFWVGRVSLDGFAVEDLGALIVALLKVPFKNSFSGRGV